MNSNLWTKWAENKYNRFLFLLLWLLVSIALPERQFLATGTILILFLVTMLSIVRQLRPNQWWLKYYAALVFLNIALLGFQW
ncbi:hypothetical protein [Leptolyngbya ohadii]|uniref:hypothetical protein n=1 Tax=Leptolyngbya ohadii TaxID=1962290 RepID=UPI0015C61D4D|nr:hypothetical protein [Leptolyngbya ohadii]